METFAGFSKFYGLKPNKSKRETAGLGGLKRVSILWN